MGDLIGFLCGAGGTPPAMNTAGKALLVAGAGAIAVWTRRMKSHEPKKKTREDHWLAVTVYRSADQISAENLPEPLAGLRGRIELRIRPAAGDKGTELHAKPLDDLDRDELRTALRKAKSIIETGTVAQPDTPPSTRPGPAAKVLHAVKGEGRL